MNPLITSLLILAFVFSLNATHAYPKRWVASSRGLILRTKPSVKAAKITRLKSKSMVYLIRNTGKKFKLGRFTGNWVLVSNGSNTRQRGYVPDAWLHNRKITGLIWHSFKLGVSGEGHPLNSTMIGPSWQPDMTVHGDNTKNNSLQFMPRGAVYSCSARRPPGLMYNPIIYNFCIYNYILVNKIKNNYYSIDISCSPRTKISDIRDPKNGQGQNEADMLIQGSKVQAARVRRLKSMHILFNISTVEPSMTWLKYNRIKYRLGS